MCAAGPPKTVRGKDNTGQDRYGYRRTGEVIEIVPEEAEWVKQIFETTSLILKRASISTISGPG